MSQPTKPAPESYFRVFALSKRYGLTQNAVQYRLNRLGMQRVCIGGSSYISESDLATLDALHNSGYSVAEFIAWRTVLKTLNS